ncbi:response regulator receiver protein [Actinosynnema sp. ALI-1.44]|uniref:fused response regulator/phosphatase n=1 Tax=Actinosynnema sp. ALI-1.44 TaxID=1933779 RepID=UPI00097BAF79|nr:fused response regulator/phosphatase [Actinosynnema sp. ALI-1.44]ONI81420.1 response regulator receiver protein [Actinosynnema sp. ALI-1.44]
MSGLEFVHEPAVPARILVVDDSEASRYITARWLRRSGHEVTEVDTGARALSVLRHQPFDLVLLDVRLPDISGFEVCGRIKADPATAALPVIHISATFVEPDDRAHGLTQGADGYLTEPVDPNVLLATVESALRYYRARVAAERLAHRLNQLTEASLTIYQAQSFPMLIKAVAGGASTMFDSAATVLIAASEREIRRAVITEPGQPVAIRTEPAALLDHLAAARLGNRVGSSITTMTRSEDWPDDMTVIMTRTKPDNPPICVAVPTTAVASKEDRNLLLQLGQASALAADGLRAYTEEHSLALTLQRSLLPGDVPHHPRLPVAVRYLPASMTAEIGGDFYEVTNLDGKLLVAIGDVNGHSIEAAAIMGEVRHALRAYAIEGHGPAEIIERLDAMLRRFHPAGYTTLCLLLVDPVARTVTMANAGHIPPMLIDQDGARYVESHGPLLGIGVDRPAAVEMSLPAGTTVMLMTDGLVERRGVPLGDDMERLRASMTHDEDIEALCDRLLHTYGRNKEDDIALLVFRVV